MAEMVLPLGSPPIRGGDAVPLPDVDESYGAPGPDQVFKNMLGNARARTSLFEPPPGGGVLPNVIPLSLWRQIQRDDLITRGQSIATIQDGLALSFNTQVEAQRLQLTGVKTMTDLLQPAQHRYGVDAGGLFLKTVTSDNLDVELLRLRARLNHDPGFIPASNDTQRAMLSGMSSEPPGEPGTLARFGGIVNDGHAFLRALAINEVAGVDALIGAAGGQREWGSSFTEARKNASTSFDTMWHELPRPAQLALEELSPLNIALAIGSNGAATAIKGMGFRGSGLLSSFIKPQNLLRVGAGDVGARMAWEHTDNLPIGLRIPLAGGAAILASSPDSLLRVVNNLDDLAALTRVMGPAETSSAGILRVPQFGLRQEWPRFWVPIQGGAIVPPSATNPGLVVPGSAAQRLFDIQPIQAGLSSTETVMSRIRRSIGTPFQWFEDNMYATPAMRERERVGGSNGRIASQAVAISHTIASEASGAFEFDDLGRITALGGRAAEGGGDDVLRSVPSPAPRVDPSTGDEYRAGWYRGEASVATPPEGHVRLYRGRSLAEGGRPLTPDLKGGTVPAGSWFTTTIDSAISYATEGGGRDPRVYFVDLPIADARAFENGVGRGEFILPAARAQGAKQIPWVRANAAGMAARGAPKVEGFPDGPTLSGLAANYPLFQPFMSSQQMVAMRKIREQLAPMSEVFESLGHKANSAEDIIDGGFHIPRGEARDPNFVELGRVEGTTAGGGPRAGSERARRFVTQEEAFADGYRYEPVRTAIHNYVTEVGTRALDGHIANYFKSLVDPATGERMASSVADRTSVVLREQVAKVRAKAQGRRITLQRRTAVQSTEERGAARAERAGDRALDRAAAAETRANEIGPLTPGEIGAAEADVSRTVTEGRWIANDIGENTMHIRRARGVLSATERALEREAAALQAELNVADAMTGRELGQIGRFGGQGDAVTLDELLADLPPDVRAELRDAYNGYDLHLRVTDRIQARIDRLAERASEQAATVDEMISTGEVYGDLAVANRADLLDYRQTLRNSYHHDRQFSLARREVRLLEREMTRRGTEAARAGESAAAAATRTAATRAELAGFQDELNGLSSEWMRAKDYALSAPPNTARIGLPGLAAYNFPLTVANAANKVLVEEGALTGRGRQLARGVLAFNNLYRGTRATLDNSVQGIQGLLFSADHPEDAVAAMRLNLHAWNNEDVLGAFMRDFDPVEESAGRLTAGQWAARGVQIHAGAGEFTLQGGGLENFRLGNVLPNAIGSRLPETLVEGQLVRAANRAFGFTGTADRLKWASHELETEIQRTGKNVEQLVADGTADRIATSVNRLTGIAEGRFGGTAGDYMLFASRFLQARFETVVRGGIGAVQDVANIASLGGIAGPGVENRMAVRSLGKLITYGTALTIMANEVLGNETDFRPVVDGRRNSNFMRVRLGDNDWSLFGTWDSMLGLVISAGAAGVHIVNGKPVDAASDIANAYRGLASGSVALAWNLLSGEDGIGQATGSPGILLNRPLNLARLIGTIGNSVVPFSAPGVLGSIVQGSKDLLGGDVFGALSEGLAAVGTFEGVKVADISLSEQIQRERDTAVRKATFTDPATGANLRAGSLGELSDTVGTTFAKYLADSVDDEGKIAPLKQERIDQLRQKKAEGDRTAAALLVGIETHQRIDNLKNDPGMVVNGTLNGKAFREQRAHILDQGLGVSSEYREEMSRLAQSSNPIDRAVAEWYDLLRKAKTPTGLVDFQTFNDLEDDFNNRVGSDMAARVQANVSLVPQGAGEAETDLIKTRAQLDKAGFFDIRQKSWQTIVDANKKNMTVERLLSSGGISLPSIKDAAVRTQMEQQTKVYLEAMASAPTPADARMAAVTFWHNAYVKVGKYNPDVALQQVLNTVDTTDRYLALYNQLKSAEIVKWGQTHADLVNPAKKWGYIAPAATGVSPLRTQEMTQNEKLVAMHDGGASYGEIAIAEGLTRDAVIGRIRRTRETIVATIV